MKGVLRDLLRRHPGVMVHAASGSITVTSAGPFSSRRPSPQRSRLHNVAGSIVIMAIRRGQSIRPVAINASA